MADSPLTDAELRHFEALLRRERVIGQAELVRQGAALDEVRGARGDAAADDEHDPDGPTLSTEWSRLSGVRRELLQGIEAVDQALERIADGSYGVCLRRGEPIGRARLEARPAAALCIDCARELETGRRD